MFTAGPIKRSSHTKVRKVRLILIYNLPYPGTCFYMTRGSGARLREAAAQASTLLGMLGRDRITVMTTQLVCGTRGTAVRG